MELTVEEVKALFRFIELEDSRRKNETVKYCLLGWRGVVEMMKLLRML